MVVGQSKDPDPTKGKDKKKRQDEAALPQFPALSCCVLLDARFSSRQEIIKDLKASLLFDEIVEAKSVNDAVVLLAHRQPDACFIGPTISNDRAIEFIAEGKSKIKSGDCAFIALIPQDAGIRDQLLQNGAHWVIERPCSKYTFTTGVVAAILRANAGHPWKALATSVGLVPEAEASTDLLVTLTSPVTDSLKEVKVIDRTAEEPTIGVGVPAAALQGGHGAELGKIFSSLEASDLSVDSQGAMSLETTDKIKGIIDSIMPSRAGDEALSELRSFLESQIVQWLKDQRNVSREMATKNLKRKLTVFLQNQR